ncbi:unnamed protein product [Spirodela intermedia]|uniref:Uncharacterized protein n=1 Tax=Spirodela intermedia TaxID=51605 RepID=A0A7I8IDA3_SPIIN|nr:unnamed protein product [Spirodela intermedia]CAA6655778.1 unnamed protein product [Spirodela intermedia]
MAAFTKLDDSPMFRNQLFSLEQGTDELRERCQRLHKGCKKFVISLAGAYDGDIAFADSLEAFGAGHDDPMSVAIGGPVMSKFTTAFRELSSYKELLRSQVEHMLSDRLMQFISVDLQDVKESRRRFDKAQHVYEQRKVHVTEKGTRVDVVSELEEDLHNSKSAFERCRFNFVNALANIEAKKKYEFLESISAVMDAHMRYYKQGYELLSQIEPFIHQVLTYTQQSKEMTSIEQDKLAKRIQEFRTQAELDSLKSSADAQVSASGDGVHVMVQTIKQGYLFKRSSNLRGDWKRRFFVLDTNGTLYYYRNKSSKHLSQQPTGALESSGSVFSRFRFSNHRTSPGEDTLCCRTVDLRTSAIKINAEQTDLRFCFRIITPVKTYTLQAENDADRIEWVDKITAVIVSLLHSSFPNQASLRLMDSVNASLAHGSNQLSGVNTQDIISESHIHGGQDSVPDILRRIPGNDVCAECSTPEPDWASLNLGVLLCIECSGVHRNLGVHISKVRSLTLDVKVWESTILDLFSTLGNAFCNSVWEGLLQPQPLGEDGRVIASTSITKPEPRDPISKKEIFIQLKYMGKILLAEELGEFISPPYPAHIWEAVEKRDIRAVYCFLVASSGNANTRYEEFMGHDHFHRVDGPKLNDNGYFEKKQHDPFTCEKIKDSGVPEGCMQGCSLLHLACHVNDLVMLELLLQFGADVNLQDYHGRTPLHHCISKRNDTSAKYLIKRGQNALERAMEFGPITDEELFILLADSE